MVYLGRLSKEKGLLTLLKAWQRAGIQGSLKIIGTGEMKSELELYRIAGVQMMGFKTGVELHQLLSGCSFLIVPSEWYENNPMVIIEAYSYGKPVIASAIGGIPEIVLDAQTGFLFRSKDVDDLADKLTTAASIDEDTYSKMSKAAREFVEANCNPSIYYARLKAIYSDVIQNK
jgi:glycosyltransferase involved in cell wall biosynthesis